MKWPWRDSYLIIILLGHQSAFSQHKVKGSTGHDQPVAHVTKHNGEQEGEGDDGVWRWRQGGRHRMRGGWCDIWGKHVMIYSMSQQGNNGWWSRVDDKHFCDCRSRLQAAEEGVTTLKLRANSFVTVRISWHILTWVNLTVAAHSIGIHDALEAWGELVGLVIGGWGLLGLHSIEDGRHSGAALLLIVKQQHFFSFQDWTRKALTGHGACKSLEAMQTPWHYVLF